MYLPADHPGLPLTLLFKGKGRGPLPYPFTASNALFLNLGRNCIYHAISIIDLKPGDVVLLPAYLDDSVIEPFLMKNILFRFYRIDMNFKVDFEDISSKIDKRTKAILAINYFGFPQPLQMLRRFCDENNLFFIEDNANGFLSRMGDKYLGSYGDISVFSFRKTLPLPDGAALVINNHSLSKFYICLRKSSKASSYLGIFDLFVRDLQLRYDIEVRPMELVSVLRQKIMKSQYGNRAMSNLSMQLTRRIDYQHVYRQRRDHFKFISHRIDALEGIEPIFKQLPTDVCPWGFPILVNNRDRIQKSLRRLGIMLPTHWRLPDRIPVDEFPGSRHISEHILTLPVFQGLGIEKLSSLLGKLEAVITRD